MTYQAFLDRPLRSLTHDRSFKTRVASPRRASVAAPDPADYHWLSGFRDPAVFDGLDRPWWRLLPQAVAAQIATWRQRIQARRTLAQIDTRSLRDAGIDPGAAQFEAAQPFWRPQRPLREVHEDQ